MKMKVQLATAAAILSVFADFDDAELTAFVEHCGIRSITSGDDIGARVLAHYWSAGSYDIDRAARDLATWPPVAARIEELSSERRVVHGS